MLDDLLPFRRARYERCRPHNPETADPPFGEWVNFDLDHEPPQRDDANVAFLKLGLSIIAAFAVVLISLVLFLFVVMYRPHQAHAADIVEMHVIFSGKMSTFGGPGDPGVASDEGLALIEPEDISDFNGLFLDAQPPNTTGLARRLDPQAFYVACRWDYGITSKEWLRGTTVVVSNPATRKSVEARPVDWGPDPDTGRVADLSPGLAAALGLLTDDICEVSIPDPSGETA